MNTPIGCGSFDISWAYGLFNLQLSLFLVVSLFGFIGNILNLIVIPKVKIWSINVRLILINISICALMQNLYVFVRFFVYDRNYFSLSSSLQLNPISFYACQIQETVASLAGTPLAFSVPIVVVERWLVTKDRLKPLESRPNKFVVVTVALSWFMGLFSIALMKPGFGPQNASLCFCSYMLITPFHQYLLLCLIFFAQELIVNCLFYYVLHLNRTELFSYSLNTARHSLARRFELRSTIQITEMLFPSVLCHTIFYSLAVAVSLVAVWYEKGDLHEAFHLGKASLVTVAVALFALHASVHPFMLFYRSKLLRTKLRALFCGQPNDLPQWAVLYQQTTDPEKLMEIMTNIWNNK